MPDDLSTAKESVLAQDLLADPNKLVGGSVVVRGFLVKVSDTGRWWRLYRTLDLKEYIEFQEVNVLWYEQPDPADRLGITIVWLRPDARVLRTDTEPVRLQMDFFQGEITGGYWSQAAMPVLPRASRQQMVALGSPGCGTNGWTVCICGGLPSPATPCPDGCS